MKNYFEDYIESKTLDELADDFSKRLRKIVENRNEITGIRSGFHELDALTKGFHPGQLVLIGADKGMGKTAFSLSLIKKIAIEKKYDTGYFSFDISADQLMMRMIGAETGIAIEKLRVGLLDEIETEEVQSAIQNISTKSLTVVDYPFLTLDDIEDKFCEFGHPENQNVLIIDSLNSIAKSHKDKVGRELNKKDLAKITFKLKELALKWNTTIIVFFNLNIKMRRGHNNRPLLSDARRYAPIDKLADMILFLYRPEYYKIDEWDDEQFSSTSGQAEIIIAKNKYGILDNVRVQFNGSLSKFDNLPNNPNSDIPF